MSEPLGVAQAAGRLTAYAHVLREAVHLSCSRIAHEPRLDVKLLLADQIEWKNSRWLTRGR